jgi:hypothetical protein
MKIRTLGIIFLVLMTGCYREAEEKRLTALEQQTETLKGELESLKSKKAFEDLLRDLDKVAYLTPGDDGYSAIKFDLGILTVRLIDIKPYANGSKITLEVGNTLSAGINGLKVTIEWGKVDEKGSPINEEAKSKEVTLKQSLRAGSWTRSTFVLDGVPPTELGFVRLRGMTHEGILLSRSTP